MSTNSISMGKRRSDTSHQLSEDRNISGKITLYEELRLIERNENEINVIWKGAHMTLFFLAFVFGSFCTCCFHMLMHMFDDKCILFPKVISHASMTHIVREFFSTKEEIETIDDKQPLNYLSTQWAENSACYLPTYVPLVSGLAGLVWTTMFFMCSSSTPNITGAQRIWRALPLMFVFSVAMAILCIYASSVTQSGLKELCYKLDEVTGDSRYTYALNVVTLAYERRIRGVYQATHLSIASAWLHTTCWILSALLIVLRVLLAVDFTLVLVKAQLIGNLDDMLQKYEKQVDSISAVFTDTPKSEVQEDESEEELFAIGNTTTLPTAHVQFNRTGYDTLRVDKTILSKDISEISLHPKEKQKLENKFITNLVNNLVNNIGKSVSRSSIARFADTHRSSGVTTPTRKRMHTNILYDSKKIVEEAKAEKVTKEFMRKLRAQLAEEFKEFEQVVKSNLKLQSLSSKAELDRRSRSHSSSDDEIKITEVSSKKHQTKDEDRKTDSAGEKDGAKNIDIQLNMADASDEARKLAPEKQERKSDEKEPTDNWNEETGKIVIRDEKAEYSGFKRAQVKFEFEPDEYKKETDKDEKKQNIELTEVTEGIKIVRTYTPLRISDDANQNNKTVSEKDKSQENEENKEDEPKYVNKTHDNVKSKEKKEDSSKDVDKTDNNDQRKEKKEDASNDVDKTNDDSQSTGNKEDASKDVDETDANRQSK